MRSHPAARWLPAGVVAAVLVLLLSRTSAEPEVFSRYSLQYFGLCLGVGTWLIAWLWIAADARRVAAFWDRAGRPLPPATAALVFAVLVFDGATGIIADLLPLAVSPAGTLLCLGVAAAAVILATRKPIEATRNLALAAGSVLVALCVAEVAFRALLASRAPTTDRGFEEWVASGWPRPVREDKPAGTFRILGLADSFGTAGGEDNYHYVLEQLLLSRGEGSFEVVNLSVGAFQLPDELAMFEQRGAAYRPDLVLHGFFVGNDFDVFEGAFKSFGGIRLMEPVGMRWLRPHDFMILDWLRKLPTAVRATAGQEEGAAFSEEAFLRIEAKRMNRVCGTVPSRPETAWRETLRAIDVLRAAVEGAGAGYAMVIHPDQFQVETALREEVLAGYNLNPASYDVDLPQRFLLEHCEETGTPCLDLLPELRRVGSDGGLYLTRNTHYNARGNDLAAVLLDEFLASRGLIPEPATSRTPGAGAGR